MNKKVIGGASAVLLLVAAVMSTVALNKHHSSSTGAGALSSSEKLVKAFCQPTDHSERCEAELLWKAAAHGRHARSPADLTEAMFHVTSGKISEAIGESKALIDDLHNINTRTSRALHNCGELLGYAVDDVKASLARLQAGELSDADVGDLRTWLSGALTFQETCLDGVEHNAEAARILGAKLGSSLELTEDILAIVEQLPLPMGVKPQLKEEEEEEEELLVVDLDRPNVTVAADGSGDFKTITEALAKVPRNSSQVYVVHVKAGIYGEYVSVPKDVTNLAMIGDGADATVITGSRNFMMNITTKDTATVEAIGDGFFMRDIKVENTAGPAKYQAVALRVQSDQAVFHRCTFEGFQDTLYAHCNRQFFRDCTISGTVDFIFGNSQVVLQNCLIQARRPMDGQANTITAQGRRLALATLFYAEVDNRGPGADTSKRVMWGGIKNVTYQEADKEFTVETFFQGHYQFIPKYGVPLIPSLLPPRNASSLRT